VKSLTEQQTYQQSSPQHQLRLEPSPQVQAELTTLNMRYRDMQDTMSRIITMLVAENVELKTENTTLKNQLNTENSNKKQP
jgi:regulator of replication initiation timing